MDSAPREIAPGLTVSVAPVAIAIVPLAEIADLRRTAAELVRIVEAMQPMPGSGMLVRSAQGLARAVAARAAGMGRPANPG